MEEEVTIKIKEEEKATNNHSVMIMKEEYVEEARVKQLISSSDNCNSYCYNRGDDNYDDERRDGKKLS